MEWISVKNKNPKKWLYVLVTDGRLVGLSCYIGEKGWIGSAGDGVYGYAPLLNLEHDMDSITHWMALPKPPKD